MTFCKKNTWCSHLERVTTPNIIEPNKHREMVD